MNSALQNAGHTRITKDNAGQILEEMLGEFNAQIDGMGADELVEAFCIKPPTSDMINTYPSLEAAIVDMRVKAIHARAQAQERIERAIELGHMEAFYTGAARLNEYQNLRAAYFRNCLEHAIIPDFSGLEDPCFPVVYPVKSI